jgi:phospho-N-acetylmuramoyl-pentapeptide-transferase
MMQVVATLFVFGLVEAGVVGAVLLPLLQKMQVRQHAYEDAPATHQVKTGTPTMGGVVFIVALAGLPLVVRDGASLLLFCLIALCGLVGFIDDMMGVLRGRNRGLTARTKFLATALVAVTFLNAISNSYSVFPRDVIFHSGTYALVVPHIVWLLIGILAITGTIHAVNLTDGLDGLATGTMIPPLLALAAIGYAGLEAASAGAAALGIGACLGFFIYNRHPARMFMGDTGSLALGALLSGIAILEGEMLLLIVIGGVFVVEALSVIAQVTYFKATGGKRILRMSPLHHHFELGGWPETKVTTRFWAASAILSAVGWVIAR